MHQKVECDQSLNKTKKRSWISGTKLSKNIWPFGNAKRKRNIFSTRVETWKYHHESLLCPVCNEHVVPIIFTKRHKFSSSRFGATCLLGCWPLCLVPLMLSQEKQARLVCPFCGHNYGNYAKSENKSSDGSSVWYAHGGQQRLVEIMTSKLNHQTNEQGRPGLQPNSELGLLAYQKLWEVQDASQQTTDNAKEKEKEVEIEEEENEEEEEEEEEEEGRDASVPKVFQNLSRETTSQRSEGCSFCSSQVTPDRCYETQHFEISDLDNNSNWSTYHHRYHHHHHDYPYPVHRKTRLYD